MRGLATVSLLNSSPASAGKQKRKAKTELWIKSVLSIIESEMVAALVA